MNVGKMWKTPETCGKLAKKCGKRVEKCLKNVDNCPKNVGNFVDKMWECGKHVGNSFVCANVQNCRQLYKRESIFFFLFFFFSFFLFFFFYCISITFPKLWLLLLGEVVLFNCMLSHVGTERERRTCNEWLCTGVMRMVVIIYLKLAIFVYTSVYCFNS